MDKKILTVTLNPAIDYTIEVEQFKIDIVNRAEAGRRDPGGKGINVATALNHCGLEADVTGFLGKENRKIFHDHFKKNKIRDRFIYIDGKTREGIKVVDSYNKNTTDINFPGFLLTKEDIDKFIDHFTIIVPEYNYVVLSGSLPIGVSKDIYVQLGKIAKDSGVFVVLDTSGVALKKGVESRVIDLIKPNFEELSAIYPELKNTDDIKESTDKLCRGLLNKVGSIALSLGEEGSCLYTKNGTLNASAPAIRVKSSVGAGDTFLAGYLYGLVKGFSEKAALINAGSWAASKLTIFGPGLNKAYPPDYYKNQIIISNLCKYP